VVLVRRDGFEWQGKKYKSLTAVAKAVTGKHWTDSTYSASMEGKPHAQTEAIDIPDKESFSLCHLHPQINGRSSPYQP